MKLLFGLMILVSASAFAESKKYVVYNKKDLMGTSGQAKMMTMVKGLKPLEGVNGFVFEGDPKSLNMILNDDWVVQEELIHKILE